MSWLWLGILVLAGVALWLRRRRRLQQDAALQESLDHLGPQTETKQPPAKQPWQRPGFGPSPRPDILDFGGRPIPPPAGSTEDPSVAGPLPDDEDIPVQIIPEEELAESAKPPPPPPPGASDVDATAEEESEPAVVAEVPDPADPVDPAAALAMALAGEDLDEELIAPIRGPQVLELPPEIAAEARDLMNSKQEVAAVRLVCDSMDVGILDAQRTVRALVGR